MLGVISLTFIFHMYLENSLFPMYFFWWKSFEWFLKLFLNLVFVIPKCSLSGFLGPDTTALHTVFVVTYSVCTFFIAWEFFQTMSIAGWLGDSSVMGSIDLGYIFTRAIS